MEQVLIYSGGITLGLVLLTWSADRFVDGASGIAEHFSISPLVIGLTIVAFSTSAPEMLVSAFSAWQGNSGLAIGNAVGSNIANMTLVLGVAALLMPIKVGSQTLYRETPLLLLAMVFALILLWNNTLSRIEGMLLMSAIVSVILFTLYVARKESAAEHSNSVDSLATSKQKLSSQVVWWLISGLVVLLVSAKLLVWAAVGIAQSFGVSDLVIGLTVVAIGTSLPELAASITAIKKGEHDMAVGNVIGSCMFNILAVLGIVGLVGSGPFEPVVIVRDYPLMIGLVIIFYLFTRRTPRDGVFTIQRWVGGGLLTLFFAYQGVVLLGSA